MSKSTAELYGKKIKGISQARIGASVDICRISRGITNPVLAKDAGDMKQHELREFEAGTRCLPAEQVDKIRAALGPQTLAALVEEAKKTPPLTKQSVATAIYRIALHRDISIAALERDAGYHPEALQHFVGNRNAPQKHTMALEQTLSVAKKLGFNTLGEMLIHERGLDPELESPRYHSPEFRDAVKRAQAEGRLTAAIVSERLNIKKSAYEHMLSNKGNFFPIPVLRELPNALELKNLEHILVGVSHPERVEDRRRRWAATTDLSAYHQTEKWAERVEQTPSAKRYPVETKERSR